MERPKVKYLIGWGKGSPTGEGVIFGFARVEIDGRVFDIYHVEFPPPGYCRATKPGASRDLVEPTRKPAALFRRLAKYVEKEKRKASAADTRFADQSKW